jgi:hypothetical protein
MSKTNVPKGNWTPMGSIRVDGTLPFRTGSDVGMKSNPSYCRRCGSLLLYCTTTEDGTAIDEALLQDELALGVCHRCYPKEMEAIMKKQQQAAEQAILQEESPEVKKAADEQYEAAVKKLMEELAKKNGLNTPTDL